MKKILVTVQPVSSAFISRTASWTQGTAVVGIDSLNDYYDVNLKLARLARLVGRRGFVFMKINLADRSALGSLFCRPLFRYCRESRRPAGGPIFPYHPYSYIDSNIVGSSISLKRAGTTRSGTWSSPQSSSVYGANTRAPFSYTKRRPSVSLYAATKKSSELMAHAYSSLYGLPLTGLRFFTVYGPWGRPDMAYFSFTKAILEEKPSTFTTSAVCSATLRISTHRRRHHAGDRAGASAESKMDGNQPDERQATHPTGFTISE